MTHAQAMGSHAATRPAMVACTKAEVLVVDDDRHFRALVRNLLEPDGMQVMEAPGVGEGLAYLKTHEVDAVIMDLIFPDGDGIQAIRRVKTAFPGAKVIAVSGVDSAQLYLRISGHLGADAVLPKAEVESLSALVMRVLER